MTLTIKDSTVTDVNSSLVNQVLQRQGFSDETCIYPWQQGEFCGYYVVSLSSLFNHFQHQVTSISPYDDITFSKWKTSGSSVVVEAISKSEYPNAYDDDTNFCNIFNLFRNGNASTLNYDLSIQYDACQFHPDTSNHSWAQSIKKCNKY